MDYGGRYSFSCGQGVKEVLKALTRSQEDSYDLLKLWNVPGKFPDSRSPTAGGSLEQLAIAPETPIQCTTLLRSFESPERTDIYDEDGQSSETVKKEICRNLDQELISIY
ncbi:hypothetical protein OIU84_029042 [Salix udensis]|uniref:Uncharacterized protein n=1 Tax=Salix udensis TaxID=889485 RepID=A0AAD6KDX4_9ROSI|nr:hypothetical protein OIU84_029042 [Salix udensis]